MNKDDRTPNSPNGTVVEHPQLKRDRAFALYLARCHAHNHGKPLPDPATIGTAVMTRLTPEMSHDQKVEKLVAALERRGIKVNRDK